jgi:hypothetical protein
LWSGQRLGSGLGSVYLEDVGGYFDGGLVGHFLELEVRVGGGFLKTGDSLGGGFCSPAVEDTLPACGATKARGPMNF